MRKNLVRHGNSLALVIEKPILDLLGVDAATPFEITTDGQALVMTPTRDTRRGKAFRAALASANLKYAKDLRRLAE